MPSLRPVLILAILAIAACGPAPTATSPPPPTPSATIAPSRTPTATASATPAPEPTQCASQGQIREDVVDTSDYGRQLPFRIYLPPCYQDGVRGWPALYLLHGVNGDDQSWLSLGLAASADRLMASGAVPGFLIVFPWHRNGLDFEPAVLNGLLPYVEEKYGALPGPTWRAVGGLSRGGRWAFRLTFRYPDVFSAVGLHSPGLRTSDLNALPAWLEQPRWSRSPRVRIDIGDDDSLLPSVVELVETFDQVGVVYEYELGSGAHEAAYWEGQIDVYLRWYGQRW